jgi:hypothetical protein
MAKRSTAGIGDALSSILFIVIAIILLIIAIVAVFGLTIFAVGLTFSFNIIYLIFLDKLDTAQLWTFSILLSLAVFVMFFLKLKKNLKKTATYYLAFNLIVLMINFIAVFGFHNTFSVRLLSKISDSTYQKEKITESFLQPSQIKAESNKNIVSTQEATNSTSTPTPSDFNSDKSVNEAGNAENIEDDVQNDAISKNNGSQDETETPDLSISIADSNYKIAMQWFKKYKDAKLEGDLQAQNDCLFKSFSIFKHSILFGNEKALLMYYLTSVYLDDYFSKDEDLELLVKNEYPNFPTLYKIEKIDSTDIEIIKEKLEKIVQKLNLNK